MLNIIFHFAYSLLKLMHLFVREFNLIIYDEMRNIENARKKTISLEIRDFINERDRCLLKSNFQSSKFENDFRIE